MDFKSNPRDAALLKISFAMFVEIFFLIFRESFPWGTGK